MSKLSDALRRVTQRESRPIGFTATATKAPPTMLVLAQAGGADAGALKDAGADGAILQSGGTGPDGSLWGVELTSGGREKAVELAGAGCAFIVFDAETTDAAVLLEDDLGFIMRVDPDASDTFLRTVEGLPVDALLVPGVGAPLTVRRTLDLRRITGFTRKPLIVEVDAATDGTTLETLRDCGAIAVVANGTAGATALRAAVDALPPRKRKGEGRGSSLNLAARTTMQVDNFPPPEEPDED